MRKTLLSGTAAIALAAVLAFAPAAVIAGETATDSQSTEAQAEAKTDAEMQDQASGEEANTKAEMEAREGIDAAALIGDSVENGEGEVLGDIETLVVAKDGGITHVILGVGGFLGIGEKEVAVGWDRFTVYPEEDRIVADLSTEELESAPDFDWPDDYEAGSLLDSDVYDQRAAMPKDDQSVTDQTSAEEAEKAANEAEDSMMPVDRVGVGSLIGADLMTADGEEIGEIDDVVLSSDGKAEGVITEVGGFLGMGEKQVLISWDELDIRRDEDGELTIYAAVSAETLEQMPEYEMHASY